MEMAKYEIVEEDGTYWGEVPGLQGVWAKHRRWLGASENCARH